MNLLLKIKNKATAIAEGWWLVVQGQLGNLPPAIKEMAEVRLTACAECPQRVYFICGICTCPLVAKSKRHDEYCPHPDGDKWDKAYREYLEAKKVQEDNK